MPTAIDRARQSSSPLHAFLLAATVPPFLGAALTDYAYASSYQVQWINFSSWLIVGGLVFGGAALVCALVDLFRASRRGNRFVVHLVLLLAAFVVSFVNAFVHAGDAWASMPMGLILSLAAAILACVATVIAFSGAHGGGAP